LMTVDITPEQLAYFAGILDGEGCVSIIESKQRLYPVISIVNTNKDLIQWLYNNVDNSKITERKATKNKEKIYRWQVSRLGAVSGILIRVLPYLIVKELQAKVVIRFCADYYSKNKEIKRAYILIIRELNSRGTGSAARKARIEDFMNNENLY
jgi:hypothetical protein